MNCPHCGYELEIDSRVCKHCDNVVWNCWHCGHEIKYDEKYCRRCGKVYKAELIESTLGKFFVFAFWGLLLSPLYQTRLGKNLFTGTSIFIFIGICITFSLMFSIQEIINAWKISKRYDECMANPPRHDCADWKYKSTLSCVQTGKCRRCEKNTERFLHPDWTAWENISETSCMQSRKCLRCGTIETRGPDHNWKSKGIIEGIGGYYDDEYYKYETYECIRCGGTKHKNR